MMPIVIKVKNEYNFPVFQRLIKPWLEKNIKENTYHYISYRREISFEFEEDATLFLLVWGGVRIKTKIEKMIKNEKN